MVTDFLFGFRTLTLSYADLTLSHCNIDLLFVNLVNLVNLYKYISSRFRYSKIYRLAFYHFEIAGPTLLLSICDD